MQIGLDSDVIQRVSNGDRAAIGVLFERYHMGIFRYLYYKVGDVHTAEDLTSEVFLRLLRSLSQQRPNNLQFNAWLYKIARNLAIDHYRKHQAQQPVSLEENLSTAEMDDLNVDNRLNNQLLYKAVNQLPFDQREVVILRFINNLPIAEAARVMERSEDAIKGLQRRALSSLRQVLVANGIAP
jgi:RNA polymerase sigma-70 factor (ECF subfamily)